MKIAIVGAGVAGSYLANRLRALDQDVVLFELMKQENHWPICAWGTCRYVLEQFSQKAGLDFTNYILHKAMNLRVELPNQKTEYFKGDGWVTFDKLKWEQDLLKNSKIIYGLKCSRDVFPVAEYDFVLDCTGFYRALLPKPKNDFVAYAYEYLIDNADDESDFIIKCSDDGTGYFWYFPLGKGLAYIGVASTTRKWHDLERYVRNYGNNPILRKIGRPVRLSPPKFLEPFFSGNIIGIGESIGCVFPVTGEGIIPVLLCCDIFLQCLNFSAGSFDYSHYRKQVLRNFSYYGDAFVALRLKMADRFSLLKHFRLVLKVYLGMKREKKRFGFEVHLQQLIRILRAFEKRERESKQTISTIF
jgi:flavin-dependent dehydrogenase